AAAPAAPRVMLSAADFGAVGDGQTDDTAALQSALDAAFAPGRATFLRIPPRQYRITRTLRITAGPGQTGTIARLSGSQAHGPPLVSEIRDGSNVLEIVSRATVRFLLFEGLDIEGSGREGHGIHIECPGNQAYLYNFCLRDTVVQHCGGDGCRMIGDVFEG